MEIFCAVLVPVSESPVSQVNRKRHPRLTDSSKTSSLEDLRVQRAEGFLQLHHRDQWPRAYNFYTLRHRVHLTQ